MHLYTKIIIGVSVLALLVIGGYIYMNSSILLYYHTTEPERKLEWGIFTPDIAKNLPTLETTLGKKPNIVAHFIGWDTNFPSEDAALVGQQGQTLLIFWEPTTGYDKIINGSYDTYIQKFAADAAAYSYPIILIPFPEMNLNEGAWGYGQNNNTAAKFIEAWRHTHNLFASAPNVKFGLAFNNGSVPDVDGNHFDDYYPGGDYVDYVGLDGFNFGDPWQPFGELFDTPMNEIQKYNKPIYIFSMASVADQHKATWIAEGLGYHVRTYKNIVGWVWFNENSDANWLIDSDPASLEAFKKILP